MGNSHAAAPPAVPPVVTGTTPAVNAVPVENQTQRVSWCARAEQRYAKDAPLLPSEVRALFTDVFDNVLNRQLGYTDEENERNARLGMKLYDDRTRTVVSVGVAQRVSSVILKSFLLLGAVIACMYSFDIGKEMLMLAETKRVEAIGLLVAGVFTVACVFSGWDEARK